MYKTYSINCNTHRLRTHMNIVNFPIDENYAIDYALISRAYSIYCAMRYETDYEFNYGAIFYDWNIRWMLYEFKNCRVESLKSAELLVVENFYTAYYHDVQQMPEQPPKLIRQNGYIHE